MFTKMLILVFSGGGVSGNFFFLVFFPILLGFVYLGDPFFFSFLQ